VISRLGEVWEARWASFPDQLLVVVEDGPGPLTCLDLLSGEVDLWLSSDLKEHRKAKLLLKRIA